MLTIQARFTDTRGKGIGRWRNYYRAEDMREARWYIGHLAPTAQVRIMEGKTIVLPPRRASEVLR